MSYEQDRANIKKLIRSGVFENKRIVLWQVDGYARNSISIFTQYGMTPDVILSFDERLFDHKVWGIPVSEPFSWLGKNKNDAVILMSQVEYSFHGDFLINVMGVDPKQIYINLKRQTTVLGFNYQRFTNHIEKFFRTLRTRSYIYFSWIHGFYLLLFGCHVYRKIRKKVGSNTLILFVNFTGLGDAYLLGALFDAFKKKTGLREYIFLTYSKASAQIIEQFEDKSRTVTISLREKEAFERYIKAVSDEKLRVKQMVCLPEYKNVYVKMAGSRYTLFFTFSKYIYGLKDHEIVLSFPKMDSQMRYAGDLFQKAGLPQGKTVILAPNANSEPPLSYTVWEKIAGFLIRKGYAVVTMSHGDEKVIKHTRAIDFPLDNACEVVTYAGYFIGVRCGFTDLISQTDCRKVILYPQSPDVPNDFFLLKHMNAATIYEHTAFNRMGIGRHILDIPVDYKFRNQFEKLILDFFGEDLENEQD